MDKCPGVRTWLGATVAVLVLAFAPIRLIAQVVSLDPAKMPVIGTVDERFQSYNIEMVEVTGGRFWKPYRSQTLDTTKAQTPQQTGATPVGMNPDLYQYRSPIDLSNPRLRKLAAALSPAYVRVSGTWANTVYFYDSDDSVPSTPPAGFNSVLTRKEWKGVIDFAQATHADIVTSFATSAGARDAKGVWTPEQAGKLLAYTKSAGGKISATEFMNEPTIAALGGAPKGYDAAAYGRDIAVFHQFVEQATPGTLFVGPGSVGEGRVSLPLPAGVLSSEDLLKATGPVYDIFSYHLYAGLSKRCTSQGAAMQTTPTAALSKEWLSRPEKINEFYAGLRDRFEPGKQLWITETAETACGGNPWASTFLDTFRYLIEHASLAQHGVKVIMHNTLAASDYGLIDESTLNPRPNYWAALLWQNLMGTTVLNPNLSPAPNVYVYAQCARKHPGGVALLVINADQQHAYDVTLPVGAERYTLTSKQVQDDTVQLNGNALKLTSSGDLPPVTGETTPAGRVSFAPTSITFLTIPNAHNSSCQ